MVVDKEVDNKVVKQEVFKRVLLAKKSVIGFNKLLPLRTLIASNLWWKEQPIKCSCKR